LTDNELSDLQIQHAKGIGPGRARLFGRLGIVTIKDSLYYLPYRYEDRCNIKNIRDVVCGRLETVRGRVLFSGVRPLGRRLKMFELTVSDETGSLKGKWFNQPFLKQNFSVGQEVVLSGFVKADAYPGGFQMENPEYELVAEDKDSFIHTNRIVPIYRLTEGISQKQFRKIMFGIVRDHTDGISDPLPVEIMERNNLRPLAEAIQQLHFPEDGTEISLLNSSESTYHARLAFDELFLLGLGMAVIRKNNRLRQGIAFPPEGMKLKAFKKMLPFELTNAQKSALDEILWDMGRPYPMHRLLQGDVGCGKTVVAFITMLHAVECGYQAVLMAPTEVLAEQHYSALQGIMNDLGVRSDLLAGGVKERRIDLIASGEIDIVVGTHALIQEGVTFRKLGLAVIDEQHKFGVMQKVLLRKKGANPDVLVMTATPIPRSLALSIYGDLDCSVIDEMPPGRQSIMTEVLSADQKTAIYGIMEAEVKKGRQVYAVYPAIEESDKSGLRAAVQGREAFQRIFPQLRMGLLHGGKRIAEREGIMASFKRGEIDVLVCTTVIEVGVDVPNATLMMVIHAERFGLAQLHQLRGRVGRGADMSRCLLIAYEPCSDEAKRRLDIMVRSNDGFRIAEEDLSIRGPGEFWGTRQSGMPDLKVADIIRDIGKLETAKKEAFNLLDSSPQLEEFPFLRRALEAFWQGKVDLYKTG